MEESGITAAELHERYQLDPQGLAAIQLLIDGCWQRYNAITMQPGWFGKVALYSNFPDGKVELPKRRSVLARSGRGQLLS